METPHRNTQTHTTKLRTHRLTSNCLPTLRPLHIKEHVIVNGELVFVRSYAGLWCRVKAVVPNLQGCRGETLYFNVRSSLEMTNDFHYCYHHHVIDTINIQSLPSFSMAIIILSTINQYHYLKTYHLTIIILSIIIILMLSLPLPYYMSSSYSCSRYHNHAIVTTIMPSLP